MVEALPDEGGDAPRKRAPALCPPLGTISARHSATPPPEPPDIIEGLLPRDAGGFVGPGGYGKTTVMLALAVAVILGREFCGHQVRQGGRALYITAEDSRETLEGRLWRVCEAQNLTEAERAAVFERFHILDYTTNAVRLASAEAGATVAARQIGEAHAGAGPSGEAASGDHGSDRQLPAAGAGRRAAAHPGRGGSERPGQRMPRHGRRGVPVPRKGCRARADRPRHSDVCTKLWTVESRSGWTMAKGRARRTS